LWGWFFGEWDRAAALVNALLTGLGLVLVSVTSVVPLIEERSRGRLDLLLVTPLPTGTIYAGFWWGSYRAVLRLGAVPGLLVALLVFDRGNWWGGVLFVGLVLAYGAFLVSLGLALAAATARPGLAMAMAATVCLVGTSAWFVRVIRAFHAHESKPARIIALFDSSHEAEPLAFGNVWMETVPVDWTDMSTPRYERSRLTDVLGYDSQDAVVCTHWYGLWIAVCLGCHYVLRAVTLARFDRAIGRIAMRAEPLPRRAAPAHAG
jgi:hypothetical protein